MPRLAGRGIGWERVLHLAYLRSYPLHPECQRPRTTGGPRFVWATNRRGSAAVCVAGSVCESVSCDDDLERGETWIYSMNLEFTVLTRL